jgi:putative FmdB family regulatory protein
MPTYEYFCSKCGVFEKFHGINQTLDKCPKCGSNVRRLISQNSNIIFKGSGFYCTDNRSSNHPKPAASENASTAKSGSVASPTDSKAS